MVCDKWAKKEPCDETTSAEFFKKKDTKKRTHLSLDSQERFRLSEVGRDDRSRRDELCLDRLHRLRSHEPVTARSDEDLKLQHTVAFGLRVTRRVRVVCVCERCTQSLATSGLETYREQCVRGAKWRGKPTGGDKTHRVDDSNGGVVSLESATDGLDDVCGGEHASEDDMGAHVAQHRLDLRTHNRRRHRKRILHTERVLRRQCDDRSGAEGAESLAGLDVGLDTSAATRVRTRNRQHHRQIVPFRRPTRP